MHNKFSGAHYSIKGYARVIFNNDVFFLYYGINLHKRIRLHYYTFAYREGVYKQNAVKQILSFHGDFIILKF